MTVRPARLNAVIAWSFMVGSACFVAGSVPAYVDAVGGWADGITYVVGSVFFTGAAFCQLLQAQSPDTTGVDQATAHLPVALCWRAWLPHDRNWVAAAVQLAGTLCFNVSTVAALTHDATAAEADRYVWRPDLVGSVLFLVSSAVAVRAVAPVGGALGLRSWPGRIAWVNLLGSLLFMASALASYVVPSTDQLVSTRVAVLGTLLGALCFLAGSALMFPAWRDAVRTVSPVPSTAVPPSPVTTIHQPRPTDPEDTR
jgi:hypothetical protein